MPTLTVALTAGEAHTLRSSLREGLRHWRDVLATDDISPEDRAEALRRIRYFRKIGSSLGRARGEVFENKTEPLVI